MKRIVFIALICLCSGLNILAQTNIKVLKYEQPKYYPVANALGIKGESIVAVKINKDGKVFSVNYEKGHFLLKKTLEDAASKWVFSTDSNSEEREVKIIFEYRIKSNDSKKNYDKPSKEKAGLKKPYRLIITRKVYSSSPSY